MKMLRMADVKAITGNKSHSSIYERIRAGTFPAGVLIGRRSKAWPDYEVESVNAALVAGKSNDQLRQLVSKIHAKRAGVFLA
jgi:prophage regulatory protein